MRKALLGSRRMRRKTSPFTIVSAIMLLALSCGGNSGPKITSFTLLSNSVTARNPVLFSVAAENEDGVSAWYVSESEHKPGKSEEGWQTEKPSSYMLTSSFGEKTLYIWAKTSSGLISKNPGTLTFTYVEPGTEITEGWDKKLDGNENDDRAFAGAVDNDGSLYVGGFGTNLVNGSSGSDLWIRKFSPDGTEITDGWPKEIDDGSFDSLYGLAVDSDGNLYVAAMATDLIGATGLDWWIKKFAANGTEDTVNWDKKFDGNSQTDFLYNIAVDLEDQIYAVGVSQNLVGASTLSDWWIKKFAPDGTEDTANWDKRIDVDGAMEDDGASSIAFDSSNRVYVNGLASNRLTGTSTGDWVIKSFSSDGVEDSANWDKTIGRDLYYEAGSILAIGSEDEIIVGGSSQDLLTGITGNDWWIKRFNVEGVENSADWNKIYDGNGDSDTLSSAVISSIGSVFIGGRGTNIVSGSSGDDGWLKKFDKTGQEDSTFWDKRFDFGGNESLSDTVLGSDEYLYVIGTGENLVSSSSGRDWWIKKFVDD